MSHSPEKPEDILKPFQKENIIKPHYAILLGLAEERNNSIRPITRSRVERLRTGEKQCRKCKAPQQYLRNHGFYVRKSTGEIFPRHTCKVCLAEYAPQAARKSQNISVHIAVTLWTPRIIVKFYRIFLQTKTCSHLKLHAEGKRYNEREWHFEYDKLETEQIQANHSLEKMRMNKQMLDLEMSLYVECGVTARETKNIAETLWGSGGEITPNRDQSHKRSCRIYQSS